MFECILIVPDFKICVYVLYLRSSVKVDCDGHCCSSLLLVCLPGNGGSLRAATKEIRDNKTLTLSLLPLLLSSSYTVNILSCNKDSNVILPPLPFHTHTCFQRPTLM